MASARYQLPQHPTLAGPHTKDELYLLVERGSIPRGEIVLDRVTGRSHKVGELIDGMKPPRTPESQLRMERPAYQEFSGDTPWEPTTLHEVKDADAEEDDDIDPENDDFMLDDATGVPDDEIVYHGHPSWLSLGKPLLLCLLLLGGSVALIPYGMKYFALGLGVTSLTFCCVLFHRQNRDYFISGERVEIEWGIVARNSREVRIVDIRSVDIRQNGLLGMLGVGTIDFSSDGNNEGEVRFVNIYRPHRIKELVRQLQRRAGLEV